MTSPPVVVAQDRLFDHPPDRRPDGAMPHQVHIFRRVVRVGEHVVHPIFASRKVDPATPAADMVVVVARVGSKVAVTREICYPLCGGVHGRPGYEWGFPAMPTASRPEDSVATAVQALFEATSLRATRVFPTLTSGLVASSGGLTDETVCMVFVEADDPTASDDPISAKGTDVELLDVQGIHQLMVKSQPRCSYARGGGVDPDPVLISSRAYGLFFGWVLGGSIRFAPDGVKLPSRRVAWRGDDFAIIS